uniref:Uncharacterized protein n=1 Tax=Arundo donax TaxID=35708 RepID=A0A0A9AV65_ARUDO
MTGANRQRVLLQIIGEGCQHCTISVNREKQKGWGNRNGQICVCGGGKRFCPMTNAPVTAYLTDSGLRCKCQYNWAGMYYVQGTVKAASV